MSEVNVVVNGRSYRLACDDGEEDRLLSLVEYVNREFEDLRRRLGQIGDARLFLLVCLALTDRLFEMRSRESGTGDGEGNPTLSSFGAVSCQAGIHAVDAATARIEALAVKISDLLEERKNRNDGSEHADPER